MSLLFGSSRRRKLFLAAATIAAVGYASYRAYHSSAFARRRRRLLQILSTISFCCEGISESAESLSVLSRDLKSFLLSDDDSVPRSLRQAFKIGQCVEFQETATVLSAALTRSLLRTSSAKPRKEVQGCGRGCSQHATALPFSDNDVASQDMACKEIREVSFSTQKEERSKEFAFTKSIPFSNEESGVSDFQEWEKSYSSGGDPYSWCTRRAGNVMDRSRRGQKDRKQPEDLPVRLLSKLFSEPGVGFASAVAATLARNFVSAFFEAVYTEKSPHGDFSSSSEKNGLDEKRLGPAKILEVLSTSPCRMLIADSIQTSISTAVTVYIDKTKDVNFYDDIVAGITNPCHKDSIRELMTSVCNGAVETLVKTVHGAMFAENYSISDNHLVIQGMSVHGEILQGHDIAESSQTEAKVTDVPKIMGRNSDGVQSFIDGVSKTLAVPSNRKLVVDMAGTMTSEAVRSLLDMVTNTVTNYFCSKRRGSSEEIKKKVSLSLEHLQVQERSKDMASKAVVLASICLAICLHLLTCTQLLQKA